MFPEGIIGQTETKTHIIKLNLKSLNNHFLLKTIFTKCLDKVNITKIKTTNKGIVPIIPVSANN